jgi:(2Fe-2S) ferredoxin
MTRAAILLGRGQHPMANRRLREIATRLATRMAEPRTRVEPAFMVAGRAGADPLLGGVVEKLAADGATDIAVIPFMADWGYPELYDLPDMLYDLAQEIPNVHLYLGRTLSADDDVLDVVSNRLEQAWSHPDAATATVRQVAELAGQTPVTTAVIPAGELPKLPAHAQHLFVCFGRRCMEQGSPEMYQSLMELIAEQGLDVGPDRVKVSRTKCLSPCQAAPVVCLYPEGTFFSRIDVDIAPRLVNEVLVGHGSLPGHTFTAGA